MLRIYDRECDEATEYTSVESFSRGAGGYAAMWGGDEGLAWIDAVTAIARTLHPGQTARLTLPDGEWDITLR